MLLGRDRVRVLVDGMLDEPRLAHPEGVAVHRDGSIWCGGELGQVYRIAPDGSSREVVASTGGFCLGLAFGADDDLYVCDAARAAVMRVDTRTGAVSTFATGVPGRRLGTPNYPAFDAAGRLYVSDSGSASEPTGLVWRFDPAGRGELWHPGPLWFANGLAFSADQRLLYVVESWRHAVSVIPVAEDGSAGECRPLVSLPGVIPDGLAVDREGGLWVGCYEPSQILRVSLTGAGGQGDPGSSGELVRAGEPEVVFADPTAHLLCHATNIAFQGERLVSANLGRWHLTVLEVGVGGLPVPLGLA